MKQLYFTKGKDNTVNLFAEISRYTNNSPFIMYNKESVIGLDEIITSLRDMSDALKQGNMTFNDRFLEQYHLLQHRPSDLQPTDIAKPETVLHAIRQPLILADADSHCDANKYVVMSVYNDDHSFETLRKPLQSAGFNTSNNERLQGFNPHVYW